MCNSNSIMGENNWWWIVTTLEGWEPFGDA